MLRTIEWPPGSPKFSVLSICYDPTEGPLNGLESQEISLASAGGIVRALGLEQIDTRLLRRRPECHGRA
jgi:hypothetical protein